jgi:hypothetical protein
MQRVNPSLEERLVLAQVIHLIGVSDWHNVSSSLMRMSTDRGKQIVLTPAVSTSFYAKQRTLSHMHCLGMRSILGRTYTANGRQSVR